MAKFKGFNTIGRVKAPYTITDGELIKRDLLNQFYTKLGERVMRPNYGSIIWDLLMDPSTADLDKKIQKDIDKILIDVEKLKDSVRANLGKLNGNH